MAAWPSDLPKRPPEGAWNVQIVDPVVRNDPERGPPMARKRASIDFAIWSGAYILTKEQWETLRNFWKVTTGYGATAFDMFDWLDLDSQVQVRFRAAPQVQHIAKTTYTVSCIFVTLPQ